MTTHPNSDNPKQTLRTIKEVQVELGGVSRTLVYDLLRTGDLPSLTLGTRRMVRQRDLDDFVAGRVDANNKTSGDICR